MLDNCLSLSRLILLWEYPILSIVSFVLLNFIYWWIYHFNWKFYGIFFSTTTFVFIVENASHFVGYKAKPIYDEYSNALRQCFSNFITNSLSFRQNHNNLFRMYILGVSVALFVLGFNTSGLCLIYIFMMGIYVLSLGVKLFPDVAKAIYFELYDTFQSSYEITEDDLIPTSVNDLERENDNESADGDSISFSTGISRMPSYMEIEASIDKLEDDFEIQPQVAIQDLSDSDSENGVIDTNIEPSLLEDDSSSSDDKFSEGIVFALSSSQTYTPKPRSLSSQVLQSSIWNLIGVNSVVNMLQPQKVESSSSLNKSSSESDFEMLDSES